MIISIRDGRRRPCTALVLISAIIPWAGSPATCSTARRPGLNRSRASDHRADLHRAAAGYRLNLHMNFSYFADQLPNDSDFARSRVQLLTALMRIHDRLGRRLVEYLASLRTDFRSCRWVSPYLPILCRREFAFLPFHHRGVFFLGANQSIRSLERFPGKWIPVRVKKRV